MGKKYRVRHGKGEFFSKFVGLIHMERWLGGRTPASNTALRKMLEGFPARQAWPSHA